MRTRDPVRCYRIRSPAACWDGGGGSDLAGVWLQLAGDVVTAAQDEAELCDAVVSE
jgi:hypothetical protein